MTHASLFTGIGGFDLAAEWCGWDNIFQVENDKNCKVFLKSNFPKVKLYDDIKKFDSKIYKGSVDVISGGFPCQPFSIAGNKRGNKDDRHLWPEMLRIIKECEPSWVVAENVPGIIRMELDQVLSDLENSGYETTTFNIPAIAVDAWHIRKRIFIIAHSNENDTFRKRHKIRSKEKKTEGAPQRENGQRMRDGITDLRIDFSNPNTMRLEKQEIIEKIKRKKLRRKPLRNYWKTEPEMGRVADGISGRLAQLSALGNAIVPQIAYIFFKIIDEINN